MNQNHAFCEECRNDTCYTVSEKTMIGNIKGAEYHYIGKEAYCASCGSRVYVPELNDSNLEQLYDTYRRENNLISLHTIRELPEKYAIGKRPLSLLLGWGEQTFSRYFDGDVPSKQYSEILLRIYYDPAYYAKLLEAKKDLLKSKSAYEKSKKAVSLLLGAENSHASKIDSAIQYLLMRCEDITPLALQKALYYIQGFYFAFYNTFLFSENCEAWVHGPVYRDIYFRYRNYRFDPIHATESLPAIETFADSSPYIALTASETAIFDSVINNLCCYSGKILERFTHSEAPWLCTRGDLPLSAPSNRIITQEHIGSYFSAVKSKYNMVTPNDIRSYAQAMFESL
ncbi:MAG: DUF4065 domain-containing protein [Eubacterium sp.]|nr:DUF4065 domain-containing protein [Eubacterium sp.]